MVVILAIWLLTILSVIVIRYAIAMSLQNKQRVIYTTPIKVSTWHTCKMRAVAKILSCWVNASSRRGIEWSGNPFAVADPGKGPGGLPLPLFLDHAEAQKAEKTFLGDCPHPLASRSRGLDLVLIEAGENPWPLHLSQQPWQWFNWIKILITWRDGTRKLKKVNSNVIDGTTE